MVALKYSTPILTLAIAVNFALPIIFYFKYGESEKRKLNNETFFFRALFVLYLISFVLSIFFSIAPLGSVFNATIKFFVKNFIMLYLFQRCLNDNKDLKLFVCTVCVIGILISGLGILESAIKDNPVQDFIYFSAPNAGSESYNGRVWYVPPSIRGALQMRFNMVRAYSFFNIHIAFGIASLLLGFFLAILVKNKCYIINKRFLWLSIVLLLSGIFAANSKTAMVGLLILLLALFSIQQIFNFKIWIGVGIILIVALVYFPNYALNYLALFDSSVAEEGGGSSIEMRKNQFRVARMLFEMNPIFGNGVGSIDFIQRHNNAASGILGAESSWMQILPERGLLGAFVYIYWYVFTFKKLRLIVPTKIVFYFLASILIMETATGILDMALYGAIVIAIRRFYMLKHIDRVTEKYKRLKYTQNNG